MTEKIQSGDIHFEEWGAAELVDTVSVSTGFRVMDGGMGSAGYLLDLWSDRTVTWRRIDEDARTVQHA